MGAEGARMLIIFISQANGQRMNCIYDNFIFIISLTSGPEYILVYALVFYLLK